MQIVVKSAMFIAFFSLMGELLVFESQAQGKPPNIIMIVADDLGYRDVHALGGKDHITPNLDRLVSEGVSASEFYVAWPACTPSRAAFLTGRYPQRNGTYDMFRNEAPDYGYQYQKAEEYAVTPEAILGTDVREVFLPKVLAETGYRCGIFGKWDLGRSKRFLPTSRGWHEFYGFVNSGIDYYTHERYGVHAMYRNESPSKEDQGTHCTELFVRESLRFVKENHKKKFFLYLPFFAPHGSSSLDLNIRQTIQVPERFKEMHPEPKEKGKLAMNRKYKEEYLRISSEERRRNFLASVTCMDEGIGRVLDLLKELQLEEDTLILFFSDNGGGGGSDNLPLRGKKGLMFEGGVRVPFVARWKGVLPEGKRTNEFLTSLEVFPTIASWAKANIPDSLVLDGFDMSSVLMGKKTSPRERMFWQRRDQKAARVGDLKWVSNKEGEWLFDLSKDIGEKNNLSESQPEKLKEMQQAFTGWKKEMAAAQPRRPFRNY